MFNGEKPFAPDAPRRCGPAWYEFSQDVELARKDCGYHFPFSGGRVPPMIRPGLRAMWHNMGFATKPTANTSATVVRRIFMTATAISTGIVIGDRAWDRDTDAAVNQQPAYGFHYLSGRRSF